MASLMQDLLLRRINHKQFVLEQEFKSECGITVPNGFISDGLSVPLAFRWIVSPTGHGFNAALVHDYLLVNGYDWEYANERFEAQLVIDGISYIRRKAYMFGVELWAKIKS